LALTLNKTVSRRNIETKEVENFIADWNGLKKEIGKVVKDKE
jgi:hypothetical protein